MVAGFRSFMFRVAGFSLPKPLRAGLSRLGSGEGLLGQRG